MPAVSMPLIAAGIVGALVVAVLVVVIMTNADVNAKCGAKPAPAPVPAPVGAARALKPIAATQSEVSTCPDGQISIGREGYGSNCIAANTLVALTGSGSAGSKPAFAVVGFINAANNPCASVSAPAGYTLLANLNMDGPNPTPVCMDPFPTNALAVSIAPNGINLLTEQSASGGYVPWPAS